MEYNTYDEEKLIKWAHFKEYVPTIDRYVLANVYDEEYGQHFKENDTIQIIAPLINQDFVHEFLYTESMRVCAKKTKYDGTYTWYRLYYTTDDEYTDKYVFDSSHVSMEFEKIVNEPIKKYFDKICEDLDIDPKYFFRNMNQDYDKKYHEFWDYSNFGNENHPSFPILSEIRKNLAAWVINSIKERFADEPVIVTIKDDMHFVFQTELNQ